MAAAGNHIIPSAEKEEERQRAGRRTFLPFLPGLERGIMVGGGREGTLCKLEPRLRESRTKFNMDYLLKAIKPTTGKLFCKI